ncbi:MAG: gliding motility-associated ABC transporter permease subunit GldF [Bacteroidetes bacterium]|nr:MAG: gliding motility-associated ABC transporter permease subunit GldF [Bacteroidota bacterium]MBL1143957.1 gliding motility-associated ABC transporter permease subunit GldF [Bacteroidota bacterium]MCB0802397.1 gliding motility-associated ABC transporter permease subunit GldF [Flavobacteriales bacterium]NOG56758.1 gliding motility-associated ABC transporter permease subunit GldF [Bacteroidota bacterium]
MYSLLKKEIQGFLGSLIGYIVIIVFLTIMGLIMWVFPGDTNVLDGEYASLSSLFNMAPWVFMFLIPAITMRLFADENKTGTIELLLTKPITDLQIIGAKYIAGFLLVLFSLLPTLIYFATVYYLGAPVGNIDQGGMWGSYLGLLFLASGFVAIGLFSSSLSDNQVIAFIIAVFISFFTYIGFDFISSLDLLGGIDYLILKLGINEHYISMSRGVIDTRDALYFLSLIAFFIMLTKLKLSSRNW